LMSVEEFNGKLKKFLYFAFLIIADIKGCMEWFTNALLLSPHKRLRLIRLIKFQ
jgi:hypothetical protein